ncbi:MAG TPA: hypothetical protein VN685_07860, partial [Rhizomicrobium sp.]|nr:hypothetical protein [Rhizomicrobium sp.]
MHASFVKNAKNAVALHAVPAWDARAFASKLPFLKATGFSGKEGEVRLVPGRGGIAAAVLGLGKTKDPLALAAFAEQLPDGVYRLGEVPDFCGGGNAALAWRLGLYAFDRYRKPKVRHLKLVLPKDVDGEEISRIADGVFLARDLINTPPNDMGPKELADAARVVARAHGAKFRTVEGPALVR